MSNCVVREAGSLFHEAQTPTIKAYLSGMLEQGRHEDLRILFNHFLINPELSRAGVLMACYRSLNLFAVALYSQFDRGIALQLVQLAQALYDPQIMDVDEQRDILIMDLEDHWAWLSHLENAEMFPPRFQVLLDELCPGLFDQMFKVSSVPTQALTADCSPLRLMMGLYQADGADKVRLLSAITDHTLATCVVRLGMVDAESLVHLRNPLLNEAYLSGCLL